MRVPKAVRIASWILFASAGFSIAIWIWYVFAADYSYRAVSGTYRFNQGGEASTLILKEDQTFIQERSRRGHIDEARGTWRRFGEGGISFSTEFLPVGQVQVDSDGWIYGNVRKSFVELIPFIVFTVDLADGPKFRRVFWRPRKLEMQ